MVKGLIIIVCVIIFVFVHRNPVVNSNNPKYLKPNSDVRGGEAKTFGTLISVVCWIVLSICILTSLF